MGATDFCFDFCADLLYEMAQSANVCVSWLWRRVCDDSNVYQWRMRLSNDLSARMCAAMATAMVQQLRVAMELEGMRKVRGSVCNVVCVMAEMAVYAAMMALFWRRLRVNVWQAFTDMMPTEKGHRVVWGCWL